jgi:hypothetical protein
MCFTDGTKFHIFSALSMLFTKIPVHLPECFLKFTALVRYITTYLGVFAKYVLSLLYLKNWNLKFSTVSAFCLW